VLFPLDPGEDNYARGGESFEIRSRGDRDAFLIEDRSGNGHVLAAWSPDPFRFDQLAWNGHWDYRVIAPEGVRGDRETGLLSVVQQMTANQFFEYDATPYIVGNVGYSSGGGASFSVSLGSYRPLLQLRRHTHRLAIRVRGARRHRYVRVRPVVLRPLVLRLVLLRSLVSLR
jgi:hypothetical protein